MTVGALLVFVHVAANVVWIGSILAVAVVATGADGDDRTRGALAATIYRKLAAPAFGVSFLAGVSRLAMDPGYYFVATKFMHGKLTFALAVIALHHVIGGRVKKMKAGESGAENTGGLAFALFACAVVAVFFVVTKPF
ncbi:MAG TPA: CopD family protein [Polyangiaceae bacterium]|nr:CopD family protein [Polyangiaceae bacterium]